MLVSEKINMNEIILKRSSCEFSSDNIHHNGYGTKISLSSFCSFFFFDVLSFAVVLAGSIEAVDSIYTTHRHHCNYVYREFTSINISNKPDIVYYTRLLSASHTSRNKIFTEGLLLVCIATLHLMHTFERIGQIWC